MMLAAPATHCSPRRHQRPARQHAARRQVWLRLRDERLGLDFVVPKGQRHALGEDSCWCGMKIVEKEDDDGLPFTMHVHNSVQHRWIGEPGVLMKCHRCLLTQDSGNADSCCRGPLDLPLEGFPR